MATKNLTPLISLLRPLSPPIHRSPLRLRCPAVHHPHRAPIFLSHRLQSTTTATSAPKSYTVPEVRTLTTSPSTSRLIIDVREPSELQSTGRIPGAFSMPITSYPDAIYLPPGEFYDRFGFEKPGSSLSGSEGLQDEDIEPSGDPKAADLNPSVTAQAGHGGAVPSADLGEGNYGGEVSGGGVKEVVFYCKAGVRSRAAARMAVGDGGWKGVDIGEMGGGWDEWSAKGGKVER